MEHLVNPHILEMDPYKPGRPIEEIEREFNLKKVIKLASNENCFPVPAHVQQAIAEEGKWLHLYPDSENHYVRQKIAQYNGVAQKEVIVGAGSVELIRMIVTAFLKPGETVLTSEKTFSFYKIAVTEKAGRKAYVEAPMDRELRYDLGQIANRVGEKTKIIFITNPNNPTGTIISGQAIADFISTVPDDKIIVLDNAYQEYVDDLSDYLTGIPLALERKNVIVLRTFSKIYGLAGLRIGYAISNGEVIAVLNRVKPPFNLNRVSQRAAIASLEKDDYKCQSAIHNRIHRQKLFAALADMGMKVLPSQTNFLLFFPDVDIPALDRMLIKEGVIIRPTDSFGIPDAIRVTIGLAEENTFFLEKLHKALGKIKGK